MTDDQWIEDLSTMIDSLKESGLPDDPSLHRETVRAITHLGLVITHCYGPQEYNYYALEEPTSRAVRGDLSS